MKTIKIPWPKGLKKLSKKQLKDHNKHTRKFAKEMEEKKKQDRIEYDKHLKVMAKFGNKWKTITEYKTFMVPVHKETAIAMVLHNIGLGNTEEIKNPKIFQQALAAFVGLYSRNSNIAISQFATKKDIEKAKKIISKYF